MELQQIGVQHPIVKRILDIQRNTAPNRAGLFVAEGLWAHEAVLDSGVPVEVFLWCPEIAHSEHVEHLAGRLAAQAVRAYRIGPRTLSRIAERDAPDGLVSIAQLPRWDFDTLPLGESALALVADGVEIPGNLGTLIRTLDACRADCLLLTNRRTRLTHPKVLRASQGTSLRVPVADFAEPEAALDWLECNGFTVYLADTDEAVPYRRTRFARRTAIVVGSERYGISKQWYGHGFARVSVPMLGVGDSLNVSVSASVLLYEARAQLDGW